LIDNKKLLRCKKKCKDKKSKLSNFCKRRCNTNIPFVQKLETKLLTYDAKIRNRSLNFIRLGKDNDGGYVIPIELIEVTDVLMGYGISDDISFERDFTKRYNKTSYGFDCGIKNIETGDLNCHFLSECIGTSDYLYNNQVLSGKISSFSEQRQRLKLINKKILIKMDIEGAEYEVIDDILKYSKDITGIVIEIHHIKNSMFQEKILNLLYSIDQNFILVHLHGNNGYCEAVYNIPNTIELSYINKNLVDYYQISSNQKHPLPIDQPCIKYKPDCEFEIKLE